MHVFVPSQTAFRDESPLFSEEFFVAFGSGETSVSDVRDFLFNFDPKTFVKVVYLFFLVEFWFELFSGFLQGNPFLVCFARPNKESESHESVCGASIAM